MPFERRFLLLALALSLPATAVAVIFAVVTWPGAAGWGMAFGLVALWLWAALALKGRVVRPLQTIANLLAGLRQEDFSTRASGACREDALGEVYLEINTLSGMLQEQRLGALEATALLRTVMQQIDVAVFTFDESHNLQLVNKAGEKLLGEPAERVLGKSAVDLKVSEFLVGEPQRTAYVAFPGAAGRWSVKRGTFRQSGAQRHLLVMADLSRALREEERQAWQRLLRVLGHEINNSLAPINSISNSLSHLLAREPLPGDWRDDVRAGLGVVSSRSEALSRFMAAYTQLAKLPPPKRRSFEVGPLIERVAAIETRLPIEVQRGPAVTLEADSDQLEQVLINLLRNAVDAAIGENGKDAVAPAVAISWSVKNRVLELRVQDNGPGLADSGNVFVPFFTTKPGGSGIGLVLSRQIAEAHGGNLSLENRSGEMGCLARLTLPVGL